MIEERLKSTSVVLNSISFKPDISIKGDGIKANDPQAGKEFREIESPETRG